MSSFLCVEKYFNDEDRIRYSYFYVEASSATEAKQEALNVLDPGEELILVARGNADLTGWEQMVSFLEEAQIASDYA